FGRQDDDPIAVSRSRFGREGRALEVEAERKALARGALDSAIGADPDVIDEDGESVGRKHFQRPRRMSLQSDRFHEANTSCPETDWGKSALRKRKAPCRTAV